MKKLTIFLLTVLISTIGFAQTINVENIDLGTVNLFDQPEDSKYFSATIDVTVSSTGLSAAGISLTLDDDSDDPWGVAYSWVSESGEYYGHKLQISYYVDAVGTYVGRYTLTGYSAKDESEVTKQFTATIRVIDEKPKTATFELVNSTSQLADGDIIVFANSSYEVIAGEFDGSALIQVERTVNFDKQNNTVEVPEEAATFSVHPYSGGYQFTNTATNEQLKLDVSGKGAFTYGDGLATWGISISNGVAEITRNSDGTFPINCVMGGTGYRFKPYKSDQGVYVNLYKKVSEPQTVTTKFEVTPSDVLDFGNVEAGAGAKSMDITFEAANLGEDISVILIGDDEEHFTLDDTQLDGAKGGKVTVTFKNDLIAGDYKTTLMYSAKDIDNQKLDGEVAIKVKVVAPESEVTVPATVDLGKAEYDGNAKTASKTINISAKNIDIYQGYLIDWVNSDQAVFTYDDSALPKDLNGSLKISLAQNIADEGQYEEQLMIYAIGQDAKEHTKYITVSYEITASTPLPNPASVTLSKTALALEEGENATLTATVMPEQASQDVVWESDNAAVATVAEGVVTAIAEGTANITVKVAQDETLTAVCVVTVSKKAEPQTIWYTLVKNANTLQDGDKLVLANKDEAVAAGAKDGKGLAVLKDAQFDDNKVSGSNLEVITIAAVEGGFNLVGEKSGVMGIAKNEIKFGSPAAVWNFVADENGVYATAELSDNSWTTGAIKLNKQGANGYIRFYDASNNYPFLYVYTLTPHEAPVDTDLNNVESSENSAKKIISNGQVLIIRGEKVYTILGVEVK